MNEITAKIIIDNVMHVRFPGVAGVSSKVFRYHLAPGYEHLQEQVRNMAIVYPPRDPNAPPNQGDVVEVRFVKRP